MPDNTAMTVDADLATLRHALTPGNYSNGPGCQAALARVEAELSRLRGEAAKAWEFEALMLERAKAAEARCARLQQMLGAAFRECEDDLSVVICDCDVDPEATCLAHRILALAGLDTPADSHSWNQPLAKLEDGKWVDPFVPADSQEDKT